MEKRIKLNLIGITYNQVETGVYALILEQEGGNIRIPIIIGAPEAQAIECKLQEVLPPRPLTHDMATGILESFGIVLKEVEIRRLENGVFAAYMILTNGEKTIKLDSRSSDAIAMAVRTNAPIFTSQQVVDAVGFFSNDPISTNQNKVKKNISIMTKEELIFEMQRAAEEENYERAAAIKKELQKREQQEL